jgi:hypothetical protein
VPSVQDIVSSRTPTDIAANKDGDGIGSSGNRSTFNIACLFEEALHLEHSQ